MTESQAAPAPAPRREVSEQEKALSRDLQKQIEAALKDRSEDHKRFKENRQMLRGTMPNGQKLRTNLFFANLAAMRPQVYAKDPEYTVQPTRGVPEVQLDAMRKFGEAGEALLGHYLITEAHLKRRAKRLLTSAYTNAVGWWKLSWQQGRPADPLIANRLRDAQDNLEQLKRQQAEAKQPSSDSDLKMAELQQTIEGLKGESEKRIGRGIVLDFVMPDDMLVLDRSVFEIQDYMRASRLAQCVWMTRDQYQEAFGYDPEKAHVYRDKTEQQGVSASASGAERGVHLLRVFEVWDQAANRVHTVCMGEEGLCRESYSPDWCGRRWFPFFQLVWNEVDGVFMPPSDVELTAEVVKEYNESRADLEKDRKDARPFTVVRKGGSLTPTDVENIRNRNGHDIIAVEGVGGQPIGNDIQGVNLGQIDPNVYNTEPARADMEMLVGGGDAARGSVLKAKTATEAEIMAQGMRGRSAERTDVIEDLLSEVGQYTLEVLLRKLTPEEVRKVAGEDAVWPQMSAEDVFDMVSVKVRGGSTGKPDRLQEQDRWTKLMPVIKDMVKEIVAVREAGQENLAQFALALLKETLRRFDERFEVEQYLPEPKDGEAPEGGAPQTQPEVIQQVQEQFAALQQRAEEAEQKLKDREADILAGIEKARADAAAKVEVARVTAPIEAQAEVEVARIREAARAELQSQAQAQQTAAQMHQASLQAENEAAGVQAKEAGASELAAVREQLASIASLQQGMAQIVAAMGQPKPKMSRRVVHEIDPATGLLAQSRLVEEQETQT